MRMGIIGHFEERQENIVDYLLEIRHKLVQFEDIAIMYEMQVKICRKYRTRTTICTYYNLGICISQRTLSEETSLWIAHLANLSHSSGFLP